MVIAVIGLLVYVRLVVPLLQLHRPWVVDRVIPERGRATTLVLRPLGHRGLRFLPGQFAWLTLGKTPFAVEDHPFSFSSSAEHATEVAMTIKEAGDFTSAVKHIAPGTPAYLEGPHGAFTIDRYPGSGCVFVAGGVGITPVMSMLRTLADRSDRRPQLLVYGARSWEEITFREELERLRSRLDLRVVYVLSDPSEDWRGERGRITYDLLERHLPRGQAVVPLLHLRSAPMMDAVEHALRRAGVPWPSIYTERFSMV